MRRFLSLAQHWPFSLMFHFFNSRHTSRPLSRRRGFTLVEMMTSVAIIGIIAGVIAYNHSRFDSDFEVTNIAYRIALAARQAQVYGISSREFSGGGAEVFTGTYGLHFRNLTPTSFILFSDSNGDNKYNTSGSDTSVCAPASSGVNECLERTVFGRGIRITRLCGLGGASPCISPGGNGLRALDVVFKRPSPDAIFNFYIDYSAAPLNINTACGSVPCTGAAICLRTPQGRNKQVTILSTGQISVENVPATGGACS